MEKLIKPGEAYARFIAWAGVLIYTTAKVLETTKTTNSVVSIVALWIFVASLCVIGLLDLFERIKKIIESLRKQESSEQC